MITEKILQHLLIPNEHYIWGFADLNGLLSRQFSDHPYGISIGKMLHDHILDRSDRGPTYEHYKHYDQVNRELTEIGNKISNELQKADISSIVIKPTVISGSEEFDSVTRYLKAEVSHKMVATRSGLGWIGKTDLFISKKFGPRIRLVSILINQKPDNLGVPVIESQCGQCQVCVEKCPAQATNGIAWKTNVHRDEFFNTHACKEKCRELSRARLNIESLICGICISVCPIGKKKRKLQQQN